MLCLAPFTEEAKMAEPMKIRAQLQGDVADVKVLMNHPMETGRRKDAKGDNVPAHFIQNVTAAWNGKTVMEAQWSTAVSKNPFLEFKVKGAKPGDKITVSWIDNKGDKNSIDTSVN
jgi:sulfur-oxidizing protein SoxZ